MVIRESVDRRRFAVSRNVYAETVLPGSSDHEEARRLQTERFSKVSARERTTEASYTEVTDNSWRHSIHIVVKCAAYLEPIPIDEQSTKPGSRRVERIIGTARLDLRGGMLIESMIRLIPGSASQLDLLSGKVGEISTFATSPDLDKATIIDAIDAIIGVIIQLAHDYELDRLWIFPRNGFMSILWATIPGIMPGYPFTLNPDVAGWNEESERLQQFRALRLRGVSDFPNVYQITAQELEAKLSERFALLPEREKYRPQMDRILLRAMWQAQKQHTAKVLKTEQAVHYSNTTVDLANLENDRGKLMSSRQGQSFLPFLSSSEGAANYLHAVLQQGGQAAAEYKEKSYQLLNVQRGMRVLDIGCGIGVDLLPLRSLVGDTGVVVGLDHNVDLVRKAREAPGVRECSNILVFQGDAHDMNFPNETFDRVRADRAIQHCHTPAKVVTEIWRVLQPGGSLTIVEPDWKGIVLYPASAQGGDNDSALSHLFDWYSQHLPHALIGRQLRSLLSSQGDMAWAQVQVEGMAYSFVDWRAVDTVLQVSQSVHASIQEEPAFAEEMSNWLMALEQASQDADFYAMVPLFFAYARKPLTIR